jgi:hypothetical protein
VQDFGEILPECPFFNGNNICPFNYRSYVTIRFVFDCYLLQGRVDGSNSGAAAVASAVSVLQQQKKQPLYLVQTLQSTVVLPPPHIIIHAMKAFLPAAKRQQVFEWLHTYEIHQQRTVNECVELARKTAANYLFTREWFRDYGVKGKSVGESICLRAEKEKQTLQDNLKKAAERNILKTKKKITPIDSQCVLDEAELKHRLHLRVLSDVEAILDGISTATFHGGFSSVVDAAMGLAKSYPLIKWNIKLLVVKAGFDKEDMSAWYAEREMCRSLKAHSVPKDVDPLCLLRGFEKK